MLRALFVLLVAQVAVAGEIPIPKENRIANEPPGYCMWCALETIGRTMGIKELYSLKENRKSEPGTLVWQGVEWATVPSAAAFPHNVGEKLDYLGVKYRMQLPGNTDTAILTRALTAGTAVAIGLTSSRGKHAVVLVELTDKNAKIVDSEDVSEVKTLSREKFDELWDGWAVVLEREAILVGAAIVE
jgi:hypothetical protein